MTAPGHPHQKCPICHDEVGPQEAFLTNCDHMVCRTDVVRLRHCPICRQPLAYTANVMAVIESVRMHRAAWPEISMLLARVFEEQGLEADQLAVVDARLRTASAAQSDPSWQQTLGRIGANQRLLLSTAELGTVLAWPYVLRALASAGGAGPPGELPVLVANLFADLRPRDEDDDAESVSASSAASAPLPLHLWAFAYVNENIEWCRRSADARLDALLMNPHITAAEMRLWERQRLTYTQAYANAIERSATAYADEIVRQDRAATAVARRTGTAAFTAPRHKRQRRQVQDDAAHAARERRAHGHAHTQLLVRQLLVRHDHATAMLRLAEQLRAAVVRYEAERVNSSPSEFALLLEAQHLFEQEEQRRDNEDDDYEINARVLFNFEPGGSGGSRSDPPVQPLLAAGNFWLAAIAAQNHAGRFDDDDDDNGMG